MILHKGPPLLECYKPLALDWFAGIQSATPVMKRYFRTIIFDRDSRFSPDITCDMVWFDYMKFLDS